MNRSKHGLAFVAMILLFAAPGMAQDPQVQQASTSPEEAAMMQAWMAYMTPSHAHEHLAKQAGEWEHSLKMWMQPGAPPMESTATSRSTVIMGGRYLSEDFTGNVMGMPFEGHAMIGYDNAKQQFFSTWIDNMGTGLMVGWGTMNEADHSLTFTGTFIDPMDKKEKPFRQVLKHVADDHVIMEMYVPTPDGSGEFKSMEIHSMKKSS